MNIKDTNERKMILKTIAYIKSLSWGICKIILAVISRSVLLFISAFYSIGIGIAKRATIKEGKKSEYDRYLFIGIIVLISSIVYIIYSLYGYIYGMKANYHMYIAIGIAAFSFTDLTLAIIGVVKTRKSNDFRFKNDKINKFSNIININITYSNSTTFIYYGRRYIKGLWDGWNDIWWIRRCYWYIYGCICNNE